MALGLNGPIGLAGLEPARFYEAECADYDTVIIAVQGGRMTHISLCKLAHCPHARTP